MTTTLITGANKGLGLETTRRLTAAGHTVYAGMRDTAKGEEAAALGARILRLDVTDDDSVAAAIAELPELDVLVNNAGIGGSWNGARDYSAAELAQLFDTNVYSIVRLTRAALPLLEASNNAVIVNVASGVGFLPIVTDPERLESTVASVGYPTSKAAVIMLSLQYSKLLPEIRVNAVDPGYTATDLNGNRGTQTVTEGTDAIVAMATIGPDGPTGTFSDRSGVLAY